MSSICSSLRLRIGWPFFCSAALRSDQRLQCCLCSSLWLGHPPPEFARDLKRCFLFVLRPVGTLHAQAMLFLVILLLRFTLHAAMRSRVLRAIVSPSSSQVPPDPACTLHCATLPRRICRQSRLRRECSGVLPRCWRLLWSTLVSAGGVCASTAYNLRQPACNAYNGGACDTH